MRNQSSFTNLFIHSLSSRLRMVLLPATFLILAANILCSADDFVAAGEYSWLTTGLFCFRSGEGTNTQIHMERYKNGKIEELFTKTIGRMVVSPICLTNGVVTMSHDGVIRRLDLKGEYVFAAKPKEFEGVSEEIGMLDDNHIFMTATVFNKEKNGQLHHLYVVDISGTEPVLKKRFEIIAPQRITLTLDEIIVIGETNVQRLEVPPDWALKEPKRSD